MTKKQMAKEIGTWILTALLVLMFANAGIRKLFENGGWTWMFRHVGFPDWFRIVIGVLETGAAALLLLPRTAAYGALIIIPIMLGAIGTNVAAHMPLRGLVPAAVSMLVAAIVLAARWKRLQRPLVPSEG
jgi:uncharacterized membrane protein YphA (DoxX/SURF4 family)